MDAFWYEGSPTSNGYWLDHEGLTNNFLRGEKTGKSTQHCSRKRPNSYGDNSCGKDAARAFCENIPTKGAVPPSSYPACQGTRCRICLKIIVFDNSKSLGIHNMRFQKKTLLFLQLYAECTTHSLIMFSYGCRMFKTVSKHIYSFFARRRQFNRCQYIACTLTPTYIANNNIRTTPLVPKLGFQCIT